MSNAAEAYQNDIIVSLIIPAREGAHRLEDTVRAVDQFLKSRFEAAYEIILVINGRQSLEFESYHDQSLNSTSPKPFSFAQTMDSISSRIRIVYSSPAGKGQAVRQGMLQAKGQWICITDADLPYQLEFFDEAIEKLKAGYDFVSGNRRLIESRFECPTELLNLVYKRFRLGLLFNRVVRYLFGFVTTDTQAGIKAMNHVFAKAIAQRQVCPGFLADIEYFLVQTGQGFKHIDLPVHFVLSDEKSTVKLFKQLLISLFWLAHIFIRRQTGQYRVLKSQRWTQLQLWRKLLTLQWKLSLREQVFLLAR